MAPMRIVATGGFLGFEHFQNRPRTKDIDIFLDPHILIGKGVNQNFEKLQSCSSLECSRRLDQIQCQCIVIGRARIQLLKAPIEQSKYYRR